MVQELRGTTWFANNAKSHKITLSVVKAVLLYKNLWFINSCKRTHIFEKVVYCETKKVKLCSL